MSTRSTSTQATVIHPRGVLVQQVRRAQRVGLGSLVRVCMALLLTACGASHLSTRKRLAEAVREVTEAARWNRNGTALAHVDPAYRARFLAGRRGWGEEIRLAEAEVLELYYVDGAPEVTALVGYQWYQLHTMNLVQTVVQQRWVRRDGRYGLQDEKVMRGDARLFAAESGPGSDTAGRPHADRGAVGDQGPPSVPQQSVRSAAAVGMH